MAWFADDYKVPTKSSYMKFKDGDNTLRFLLPPAMGWELWISGKPVRKLDNTWSDKELASADINKFTGNPKTPQHFWACVVWNYETGKIELLNITQSKIQEALLALAQNPKWGSLDKFDINVIRDKTGNQVTYTVQPEPPTKMEKDIKDAFSRLKVDMDEYFNGGHPLSVKGEDEMDEDEIDAVLNE